MKDGQPGAIEPGLYAIAPDQSFVDQLARGLLDWLGQDPLGLAAARVFLPTRRACRSLQEAFLRAADGRALILPRLLPLGDIEEEELLLTAESDAGLALHAQALPPAIEPLKRQALLARLVLHWSSQEGNHANGGPFVSEGEAVALAAALARLVDQVETEGLSFDRLADLAPADYAHHWQQVLRFLAIVTEHWPRYQAEAGVIGPAERRRRLADAQIAAWREKPPAEPVIVAGTTGTVPATAALIGETLRLPSGLVVLPGLDRGLGDDTWQAARNDPVHPQHALAQLLAGLEQPREAVRDWPAAPARRSDPRRARLISLALEPPDATADWSRAIAALARGGLVGQEATAAVAGLQRIDCANPAEEALVIALLLRQQLESPQATAALVTPDRDLARRVASELERWSIAIDDSAGLPLAATPPGVFLRLLAEAAASGWAPVPLLALLKHPLAEGGQEPGIFRAAVRRLDKRVLRGPRPAPGLAGLRAAIDSEASPDLRDWCATLSELLAPLSEAFAGPAVAVPALLRALVRSAEALAAGAAESGSDRLWQGEAGEAAAHWVAALSEAVAALPPLRPAALPALLEAFMAEAVVRPRYGRHPRLAILGPLEARLQQFDLMILGSLNEGTWPRQVDPGPWLSRPMQRDFGLPAPERRIGLSAHDFATACGAARVVLTRSERIEGAPSVPSRWLLRLEALARALDLPPLLPRRQSRWRDWAVQLDTARRREPERPPAPTPPLAARPRAVSVTRVETWIRDPYSFYAAQILGLRALEPLDADPSLADRGNLIHQALERFLQETSRAWPADPAGSLIALAEPLFAPLRARPALWAFWWPRFCRIARWFAAAEAARRGGIAQSLVESRGELSFEAPGGPFTLSAKADRIDRLVPAGSAVGGLLVLDYKTGRLPRPGDIAEGLAPQLPLEAAIAIQGGFSGLAPGPVAELQYWALSGGDPAGRVVPVKGDAMALADEALAGLGRLVAAFDDPATPYRALPRPEAAPAYSDYLHLARVKAWSDGWETGS